MQRAKARKLSIFAVVLGLVLLLSSAGPISASMINGEDVEQSYMVTADRNSAEEYGAKKKISQGHRLEIGGYSSSSLSASSKQISAFRFEGVELPAGAEITEAYLEFTTKEKGPSNRTADMVIKAELGNAAEYAGTEGSVSARSYTQASVNWQQGTFTATKQQIRTADLAELIQELRGNGWQSGNAMAFMIDGNNHIGAVYEADSRYGAKLVLRYSEQGQPQPSQTPEPTQPPATATPAPTPEPTQPAETPTPEPTQPVETATPEPTLPPGPTPEPTEPTTPSPEEQVIEASLNAVTNSAEEYGKDKKISQGHRLEIGGYSSSSKSESSKQIVAIRFDGINLPQNATIIEAYLEFTTRETGTKGRVSDMVVRSELGAAPQAYGATAGSVSSRSYSVQAVRYSQEAFSATKQQVRTPNISSIIDEARASGWQPGNAMAFMIDGNDFIGAIYDTHAAYAPKLVIKYIDDGNGPNVPGAPTELELYQNIYINEVSAEGTTGSKECWIELYNDNMVPVTLGKGSYLTNDKKKPDRHEFNNLIIPAKGYRIVYCDKNPALGNDHVDFEPKAKGDMILNVMLEGVLTEVDKLTYPEHLYNETYGRKTDGSGEVIKFVPETIGQSNNYGKHRYDLVFSQQRGVYETGFALALECKEGTTIKYTLDGTSPLTNSKALTYTGPISISKSCVVSAYASDDIGNSGLVAHTYVLKNNYNNEVRSGSVWQYKDSIINAQQYADAMAELPIVAVTADKKELSKNDYIQAQYEYIDAHLGGSNVVSDAGAKKYGQESAAHFNSGVAVRFKRDYNAKKIKYQFFDAVEGDSYSVVKKFGKLQLKEGQDGPSRDVFSLGYGRYNETVTNTLAKQMGKLGLSTQYVHYFYNGSYMGVKTLKESFDGNTFEEYFGSDNDYYTIVRWQDGRFVSGKVEDGDGDEAILKAIMAAADSKDLQTWKKYVNMEDYARTQVLFMFIDSEREIDGVVHNDAVNGGGEKMRFNINDTDGAFWNDGKTGTTASHMAGGGGTYRYKWGDAKSRNGAGAMFGKFSGVDSKSNPGNLEFQTIVKDAVLENIGPASGDMRGTAGAALSADNVKSLLQTNMQKLDNVYRLDAAFMAYNKDVYNRWKSHNVNVLHQVEDRVSFNLSKWKEYGLTHTLQKVQPVQEGSGYRLNNPNSGAAVYYTMDGTDPMGDNGTVSPNAAEYKGEGLSSGTQLVIRPYTNGNWGPKTTI